MIAWDSDRLEGDIEDVESGEICEEEATSFCFEPEAVLWIVGYGTYPHALFLTFYVSTLSSSWLDATTDDTLETGTAC